MVSVGTQCSGVFHIRPQDAQTLSQCTGLFKIMTPPASFYPHTTLLSPGFRRLRLKLWPASTATPALASRTRANPQRRAAFMSCPPKRWHRCMPSKATGPAPTAAQINRRGLALIWAFCFASNALAFTATWVRLADALYPRRCPTKQIRVSAPLRPVFPFPGVHISRVRSLELDDWRDTQVDVIKRIGNSQGTEGSRQLSGWPFHLTHPHDVRLLPPCLGFPIANSVYEATLDDGRKPQPESHM